MEPIIFIHPIAANVSTWFQPRFALVGLSCLLMLGPPAAGIYAQAPPGVNPGNDPPGKPSLQRFSFQEYLLGTQVRLIFYATEKGVANLAAQSAWDRIRALDQRLSNYRTDSELNTLCAQFADPASGRTPVKCSDDLWNVLVVAAEVHTASEGAFDVTVAPVVRLWKRAIRRREPPVPDRLLVAQRLVGFDQVRLDVPAQTVCFSQAGVQLDLGGIGKGYIADEALGELARRGIDRALIDAGGDIAASGAPPGQSGWLVTVSTGESVTTKKAHIDAPPSLQLRICHQGVATSGDAFQSFEWQGRSYSHFIDPRTQEPVHHPPTTTVIATTAMEADALASTLCVLGLEQGLAFAKQRARVEACLQSHEEGSNGMPRAMMTPGFAALLESAHEGP